tara:strand:+ start:369 stop:989 length:621 start_codon:yes stop_codon:yes gene_type:complete
MMSRFHELFLMAGFLWLISGCAPGANQGTGDQAEPSSSLNAEMLRGLQYSSEVAVHHESQGRVRIELSSAWAENGLLIVRGVFTPDDPDFHLYSCTLPTQGIEGLGRPTRIDVANPKAFTRIGPLLADKKIVEISDDVLNLTFPVYPDGPVTLYLPLRLASSTESTGPVSLKLTYMACSKQNCHRPYEGTLVKINPPRRPTSGPDA